MLVGDRGRAAEPQEKSPQQEQPLEQAEPTEGLPPTALEAAASVMKVLKDGDMSMLTAWAHPEKGVRFSPYAYVDKKADLVFTKDELEGLMQDTTKRVWRTFAGSGELV